MNDRLAELKKKKAKGAASSGNKAGGNDIESGQSTPARRRVSKKLDQNPEMKEFFKDVETVKRLILNIKDATKRMEDIKQQIVLTTTAEREKELSRELEPLIGENNKKASVAKQLLQKLRENTEKMRTTSKPGGEADIRIRENLANTLTRKFVDVMKEYQTTQQKFKTEIKKKVKRQVQIVKPDATSEEIDAVLKSGGGSGDVFKTAILKGDASDSIRNAYANVKDKYQDVLTLESSVQELHQMFVDFALLTETQGDLLDQIEYQVKAASDYIEQGNTEMTQAIEYAKQHRKQQCICLCIILIIVGIILAVLAMQGAF
jgi:t-SNARE complex subunit (syntaxin)